MRKSIVLVLILTVFFSSLPFSVSAYRIGDTVGYALTTDIVATINGYDIPSYNVDGYTYIVAEDLRYYGFAVNYDNASRSLSISRDYSQKWVSKAYTKPYVSAEKVGKKEHSLLYTDIKTYFDGNYTHSYNINGQTIIRFDALSAYGGVSYDNNKREISLGLSKLNKNPNPVDRTKAPALGFYGHPDYPENFNIVIYKYDGNNIGFEVTSIRGRNASQITSIGVDAPISNGKCYFDFEDSFLNKGTGVLTIIDKETVHIAFTTEESGLGGWSITAAEGTHKRYFDVPENYTPWSERYGY